MAAAALQLESEAAEVPDHVIGRIDEGIPVLQALREWRGLSLWELAVISEVPEPVIAANEAGNAEPSEEQLFALARALEVDAGLLVE